MVVQALSEPLVHRAFQETLDHLAKRALPVIQAHKGALELPDQRVGQGPLVPLVPLDPMDQSEQQEVWGYQDPLEPLEIPGLKELQGAQEPRDHKDNWACLEERDLLGLLELWGLPGLMEHLGRLEPLGLSARQAS